MKLHIDFETFSKAPLNSVGNIRYSEDPSTDLLICCYRLDDGPIYTWVPQSVTSFHLRCYLEISVDDLFLDAYCPENLRTWLADPEVLIYAHNAQNERAIIENVGVPRLGMPKPAGDRYRCTLAMCSQLALPRSLADAAEACGVSKKDAYGKDLIKVFCKPHKPTRKRPQDRIWPSDSPDEFLAFCQYCYTDVLVEYELEEVLSPFLPDNPIENATYALDQEMNFHGLPIDTETVNRCLGMIDEYAVKVNARVGEITGGLRATQREKLKNWINERSDLNLANMQGKTLDKVLKKTLPNEVEEVLKAYRSLGRTSTAKYRAMNLVTSQDDRLRGSLLYHGANTGRWSGKLFQPHNLPRPELKNTFLALDLLQHSDFDMLEVLYGDPMKVVSSCIRHMIMAPPEHDLMVADYSSIEARVLCWLAGQKNALKMYANDGDAYIDMAAYLYRVTPEEIIEGLKADPNSQQYADAFEMRRLGKCVILGCGYQMGVKKFRETCRDQYDFDIDMQLASRGVKAYRNKYNRVAKLWDDMERAAIKTVKTKCPHKVGFISFEMQSNFLFMVLPSGRRLAYPKARVQMKKMPWGEKREAVTFFGTLGESKKWGRSDTYGGKLVENATQAVARDVMGHAFLNLENTVYIPITSIHDEMVSEVPEGLGSVEEFEQLLCQQDAWADGIPLAAEGYRSKRYKK